MSETQPATRVLNATTTSIRATWDDLAPPPLGARARGVQLHGTNAWVTKSSTGGFGLVLTGVERPSHDSHLQNLRVRYLGDLGFEEFGAGPRTVSRCLELTLEPPYDTETLAVIVDRLHDKEPNGIFSTSSLLGILDDTKKIFESQSPGPSKQEVIGVWGELILLEALLHRAGNPAAQSSLLHSWESRQEGRDILDFRFAGAKTVTEVKSTLGRRIHHFQGYGQVTCPAGYLEAYLVSVSLVEPPARGGKSCADIIHSIRASFLGDENTRKSLEAQLDLKLENRGSECRDSRFTFNLSEEGLSLYALGMVPRPPIVPEVLDVEWTADLTAIQPMASRDTEAILDTLTST